YAGGGEVILAGIRLHFSDEFFHRVHVDHIGVDRQDVGDIHQRGDGREVLFDVEGQFLVDGGIDPMSGGCTEKQGVAVRIGTCHGGGGQIAACAGAVINDDGDLEFFLQRALDAAGDDVHARTSGKAHDDGDGA